MLTTLNGGLMNLRSYVLDTFGSSQASQSRSRRQASQSESALAPKTADGIPLSEPYWEVGSNKSVNAKSSS